MNSTKYSTSIGIECHVQLKTKTKLFSAVGNDARSAKPNSLVSHIDYGMPGALPVLNEAAVEFGMIAAFALNTTPQKFSAFDRKHYFYPDLPMGYQITQFYHPIIRGGFVEITVAGKIKKVNIHEAHLEADAGKSIHPAGKDYSLVDLNRAGTPLLEIVSEPDMNSSKEAKAFARELYLIMRYAEISDASLFYGNMRFDVNVSVSSTQKLGTRSETKNLNSFKSVEKAVDYEVNRQIDLLEKGQKIVQETRGWDDAKQKTFSQRGKEHAHDYRYMPDPDIPPVELTDTAINAISMTIPTLPSELRRKFSKLNLDIMTVETLIDQMPASRLVMSLLDENIEPILITKIANWLVSDVRASLSDNEDAWSKIILDQDHLVELAEMVTQDKISSTAAKQILSDMISSGDSPSQIAQTKNLLQLSDISEIDKIVATVIKDNPNAVKDVMNGEIKAIGFLVGQVMKQSKGKANPELTQKLINTQIKGIT